MQKEQNPYQSAFHGNVWERKQETSKTGKPYTKTIEVSDVINSKFGGIDSQILAVPITSMEIRAKGLDKPLSTLKSIFAWAFQIKQQHQFLLFEGKELYVSVDFYEKNNLVIRIGDLDMVLDASLSSKRKNSTLVSEKSGLQWKKDFIKDSLQVGTLLRFLMEATMPDHRKIAYNGTHFSQQFFKLIRDKLSSQA